MTPSVNERFWMRVNKTDSCWVYTGAINTSGYGWVTRGTKQIGAHRLAWTLIRGPIPNGLCVLHKCDNPACVNPEHLYLGTQADNMRDRADRRRCKTQKLSKDDVQRLRQLRADGATCEELALMFGVTNSVVSCIVRKVFYGRE